MPIEILMPALSPTMEEGTLAKWHVKEGDAVAPGDVIAEIETDKATMEVEAVEEGRLGKILVGEGAENIKVNTPIALLLAEGEDAAGLEGRGTPETAAPKASPPPAQRPASNGARAVPEAARAAPAPEGARIFASPLARRLAAEAGLPLDAISGSGPRGRIVKADIEAARAQGPRAAAPAPGEAGQPSRASAASAPEVLEPEKLGLVPGTYTEEPLSAMRKAIARRLTAAARDIPHYYLTVDIVIDKLLALRKELNARAPAKEEGGEAPYKISVNDFVIRAAALALMKVPEVNATFAGDRVLRHHHADIGIAVALEGGLITPLIRAAETKGLAAIAREAADLAARARERKLKPQDYEGGSFAISNLGMFGIRQFTAVINPPHAAILAVGAGEARPVVRDGALATATVMTATMSCDHRVIDGAVGARFLDKLKQALEDPITMLL